MAGQVTSQAEQGGHDDLVMSLAIAWQLYQSEEPIYNTFIAPSNDIAKKKWSIGK